jgi:hypothetical protein
VKIKINISVGRMESRMQKLWDRIGRGRAPGGVLGIGRDGRLWLGGAPVGTELPVGGFLAIPEPPLTIEDWEAEFGAKARDGQA